MTEKTRTTTPFVLRVPHELNREIREAAKAEKISVSQFYKQAAIFRLSATKSA